MKIEEMGKQAQKLALQALALKDASAKGLITFEELRASLNKIDKARVTCEEFKTITKDESDSLFLGLSWIMFQDYTKDDSDSDSIERGRA